MLTTFFPVMTLFLLALVGGLIWIIPALTNRSIFFAVTVAPEFRDSAEGRAITARFRLQVVALTVILGLLVILASLAATVLSPQGNAIAGVVIQNGAMLAQLGIVVIFYQQARHLVLPHAAAPVTVREAALRAPRSPGRTLINILSAGPFLMLAGYAWYLRLHWNEIPARFPSHWGAGGQADDWTDKTPAGVGLPLVIAALLALFFIGLNVVIRHARRTYVSGGPAEREERIRLTVEFMLLGLAYVITFLMGLGSAWVPLHGTATLPAGFLYLPLGLLLGYIVLFVIILAWAAFTREGESAPTGDRTPDACWKWGMFYFNPDDPAILVEKRFGIGWTFNFGRPGAWLALAALLAIPVLIAVVAFVLSHA